MSESDKTPRSETTTPKGRLLVAGLGNTEVTRAMIGTLLARGYVASELVTVDAPKPRPKSVYEAGRAGRDSKGERRTG